MKRLFYILFIMFITLNCDSQILIWSEDFESYADPSTVAVDNNTDDAGADWSLTNTAVSGSFAAQGANAIFGSMSFNGTRVDDDATNGSIWTTESIDLTPYAGNITLGITYAENGNLENDDWIDIEYKTNGGAWVDFTGGQQSNDFGGPITITTTISMVSSVQIRVKMYSDGGGEKFIFDNVYVNCGACPPLPVELVSFDAELENDGVKLEWVTASETNNDKFEVYKSNNGFDWELLTSVIGAGNSTDILKYNIYDMSPYLGTSYYKIKQIDFDGTFEYSKIIDIENTKSIPINIYPMPNNGNFNIKFNDVLNEDILVVLRNSLGQEVYSKVIIKEFGNSTIAFDLLGRLSSGLYYVIGSNKNELFNKTIIVQ